ncbi:uncharacterized protein LOC103576695 [Microplitis demolitor]|uniref:uncharacterized protein LOC103576695 n=1 Tax=Microplitis demolitor TaxID=69319 RepID=UPI0006D52191|nr:uncharacterized protein LOC103576695 [Microplitis demolitor]
MKDDNLRALLILVEHLPMPNASLKKGKGLAKGKSLSKGKKRKLDESDEKIILTKKTFPNEFLLKIVPDGTNLVDFVQKVRQRYNESVQPYLITISGQGGNRTFVQGDEWLIHTHPRSQPIVAEMSDD